MKSICLALGLTTSVLAQDAAERVYLTGPFGEEGSWNLYELRRERVTWLTAWKEASKVLDPLTGSGEKGHLATIRSAEENMFLGRHADHASELWIGLTDNERFKGAAESKGAKNKGWAWVTGEAVTYTNWFSNEPNDWDGIGAGGQDGVRIERFGRWYDKAIGERADAKPVTAGYLIEWDLNAPGPIKGAVPWTRILPAGVHSFKPVPAAAEAWQSRVAAVADPSAGNSIAATVVDFARFSGSKASGRHAQVNFMAPMKFRSKCGRFQPPSEFPGAIADAFGSWFRTSVVIPKDGTYTFGVHADDRFACRIGGFPWKAAHGCGGIDPLDATTLYQDIASTDGFALGVIELPAGTHRLDLVHSSRGYAAALQIYAAPGAQEQQGSTARWRLLDHKAAGPIAWPGIGDEGWTISWTEPRAADPEGGQEQLQDGLLRLQLGKRKERKGVERIHFIDPQAGEELLFPGPDPFPCDTPSNDERFVLRGQGTLVIPKDGTYHLGFRSDMMGAMRIKGQGWTKFVKDTSLRSELKGDTLFCDRIMSHSNSGSFGTEVVGEIALPKGRYPIEVFYSESDGGAGFEVFGGPVGYPPRLLKMGGAEIADDHEGLQLVGPK